MNLVGEVILGEIGRRPEQDDLLGYGTSITFIYGEPKELQPISVFGGHSAAPSKEEFPCPFSTQDPIPNIGARYFSWAPLSGIRSIRTFYDEGTGLCRGIIFQYENGGLRAVGQCRLHVDSSTLVVRPSVLCFQLTSYFTSPNTPSRQGVRVDLGADATHQHIGNGWKCLRLGSGVLTFSFDHGSSYISHDVHWPSESR